MPLLNGQPLELHNYTKRLNDDEEVFYCELTNEIFDDYEEYCDRVITCGGMFWTCAITGKSGLTYEEALQSEQNALKNIKDFAPELRTPVLYLASLTKRKHFSDMADDVFNFVKDRFFVNESVLVCFDEGVWSYGQVRRVVLPKAEIILKYCEENNIPHPINYQPYPAPLYSYEVEELLDNDDDESDDDCQIVRCRIFEADKMKRLKGIYTKDKNRAYLKQFTEQKKNDIWKVKPAIMAKYSIESLRYTDIFAGEPPTFDDVNDDMFMPSKITPKVIKAKDKNEKLTQQSMKKFLCPKPIDEVASYKNSGFHKKTAEKKIPHKKSLSREVATKIHKKYVATIERVINSSKKEEEMRIRMEQLRKKREEKRNEREKLATFAKEWQRKREDLECEDLIELPQPCPVDCRIPNNIFGDFLMILEFFHCFRDVLKVKNYFTNGLTFELLERAVIDVEIAGPFNDILQLLLTAVFEFQYQEDDEVKHRKASANIALNEYGNLTARDAVKLATLAARWSKTYLNTHLNALHLDAISVTDILRLHLLSSGGRAGEVSSKWRFQERGGYCSTDDPGLELRINEPHILKFLSVNSVVALPAVDKIKVINCLMTQILTYATVRDVMEDALDKVTVGKKELKSSQIADAKKEKEKAKEHKQNKEKGEAVLSKEERRVISEKETERKKTEYAKRWEELQEAAMAYQLTPLGQDRGHRRYWVFSAITGLFVEDDERWPGHCLPQPTLLNKTAVAVHDDDTMTYIRNLFEAGRNSTGSDKENDGDTNHLQASPKKKHLAEMNGLSLTSAEPKTVKVNETNGIGCTAHEETCTIHNPSIERTRWHFYYREDEVSELIKALNKRGYRENQLRNTLMFEKNRVLKHMEKCPVQKLNRFVPIPELSIGKVSTRRVKGYDDANLGFAAGTPLETIIELYVRGVILDTEAKIHGGGLGTLKVPNRMAWRDAIENNSYDCQDTHLIWPKKMLKDKELDEQEDSIPSRPVSPCSLHSNSDDGEEPIKPEQSSVVRDLAMAVLQIARSLEPKYLKKPLPYEEKRPVALTVMERWEFSLMQSTSVTQVYLHLSTLENSVQWNKSVLNAKCKICRRGRDDINMLLCDGCDRGFHLYCLKPKLNAIPQGDWFCATCRPKETKPMSRSRRLFQEEEEDNDDKSSDSDVPLVRRRSTKRKRGESIDDQKYKRYRYS